jgi:two-component system phosphate regulon response regulator PhoB
VTPVALVVEDAPDIRLVISFVLEKAGFKVYEESDGEAGLAVAAEVRPDIVLLDWMLPAMSGIEVCRALRDNADLGAVAVILLTARAQESDVEAGFAAGADDYIVKPFRPRELLEREQKVLVPH